jgi:predicted ATPase
MATISPGVVVLGGPNGAGKSTAALAELFEDGRAIDEALKEAARDARRLHKALGNPMATWKDGQVVWVLPEDINIDDDSEQEPDTTG